MKSAVYINDNDSNVQRHCCKAGVSSRSLFAIAATAAAKARAIESKWVEPRRKQGSDDYYVGISSLPRDFCTPGNSQEAELPSC